MQRDQRQCIRITERLGPDAQPAEVDGGPLKVADQPAQGVKAVGDVGRVRTTGGLPQVDPGAGRQVGVTSKGASPASKVWIPIRFSAAIVVVSLLLRIFW